MEEENPLLLNDEVNDEENVERATYSNYTTYTCNKVAFLKYGLPFILIVVTVLSIFILYLLVIPQAIEAALYGSGTQVRSVRITSISPLIADSDLWIPVVDPPPFKVVINPEKMRLINLNDDKLIGSFVMPPIKVKQNEDHVWHNVTLEIKEIDYSWLHWFTKQGLKHGFEKQNFILKSDPKVEIKALFGAWTSKIRRLYSFQPDQNTSDIDFNAFEFKTTDVFVDKKDTPKGISYNVDFKANFRNIYPVSIFRSGVKVNFTIYFKGLPIFTLIIKDFELRFEKNILDISLITKPEYTEELMEFVGNISDAKPVSISIQQIHFVGNDSWRAIQDVVDGLEFNIDLPSFDRLGANKILA